VQLIPLTVKQTVTLRKELSKIPIGVLARRYHCSPLELCASIRASGAPLEAQLLEIQYVLDESKRAPLPQLRDTLRMTASQFSQLCARYGVASRRAAADLTMEEVVARTQRLVSEVLGWEVTDELPRRITSQHFSDNGLYNCVSFATKAKEADPRFRGLPAVAFLICTAYPGAFQPFQFRHAKNASYFGGRDGQQRYLDAVRWMLEEKLQLKRDSLTQLSRSKYFLRTTDLEFYGIGAHLYRRLFRSKEAMVSRLLKALEVDRGGTVATTGRLRSAMLAAGHVPDLCEVPGCRGARGAGVDIHHIIPKSTRTRRPTIGVHAAENLVALCPNHHRAARDFPWQTVVQDPPARRPNLLSFLRTADHALSHQQPSER
jgi:hypothetical protein